MRLTPKRGIVLLKVLEEFVEEFPTPFGLFSLMPVLILLQTHIAISCLLYQQGGTFNPVLDKIIIHGVLTLLENARAKWDVPQQPLVVTARKDIS